jgi:hypothetical protein
MPSELVWENGELLERAAYPVVEESHPGGAVESAGGEPGKPRLKPVNREPWLLRTVDVERLIGEDHPARAIGEFVGRLDVTALYRGIGAVEAVAGRSAWDPR